MIERKILPALIATAIVFAAPAAEASDKAKAAVTTPSGSISKANRFNRLMKSTVEANAPPMSDGIHDPANPGTEALQPPMEAFAAMPRGISGNRVDWVKALREGAIDPRSDRLDPDAKKQVMNLDIIREVKGSMPDVVYPHAQHTEWLDCAQCHPTIFVPKKGATPISMAAILMGQYCGVCHGKVAFPVSECSRCHSKPKSPGQTKPESPAAAPAKGAALAAPPPSKPASAAPARNAVGESGMDDLMKAGEQVYADTCSACHGENGEGMEGAFPPLKGSKVATGPVEQHLKVVIFGVKDTAMQPWAETLSDEEIAAVVTFERNALGNSTGDVVQPAAVKAAR